jgi:hypothetical protein
MTPAKPVPVRATDAAVVFFRNERRDSWWGERMLEGFTR